jgi:hypothetical protein
MDKKRRRLVLLLLLLVRRRRLQYHSMVDAIGAWDTKSYGNIFRYKRILGVHPRRVFSLPPKVTKSLGRTLKSLEEYDIPCETGLSNETFDALYRKLEPGLRNIRRKIRLKLHPKFLLLVTLSYLRHYPRHYKMISMFKISLGSIHRLLKRVLLLITTSEVSVLHC